LGIAGGEEVIQAGMSGIFFACEKSFGYPQRSDNGVQCLCPKVFMFGFLKLCTPLESIVTRSQREASAKRSIKSRIRLNLESLESRTLLSGLTPIQIRHAYGFDQARFLNGAIPGDGSGQTIAIVDAFDDPNISSDLDVFDKTFSINGTQSLYDQFGPSSAFLTKAMPQGQPQTDPGWALEISLDVEWAHAIAPGAKILLVEAKTTSYNAIIDAVDYARHQIGVVAVSMSWGSEEFQAESIFDSFFTTPYGHLGGTNGLGGSYIPGGITFVAASGDYGAPPEWPAVSPNVLAVGGTTLTLDDAGNYQLEAPWLFSGGGISFYEPRPSYQTGTPSSNMRTNPDVAFDADPRSGFAIYDTVGISQRSGWLQVGGTSAGAPQWAVLIAIADQGRALVGNGSLDGATQTLPAIYALPSSMFHTPLSVGSFIPGSTYSLETGRGTPIANLLIPELPGTSPPAPVTPPVVLLPPVPNVPGPPSNAPVSPQPPAPPKTTPPQRSDPAHQLSAVQISATDTPAVTLAVTSAPAVPTRSPINDAGLRMPPQSADGPIITGTGSRPDRSDLSNAKIKNNRDLLPADPEEQESAEAQLPQVSASTQLSPAQVPIESEGQTRPSELECPRIAVRELIPEIRNSRPKVGTVPASLWMLDSGFWIFSLTGLATLTEAVLNEPRRRFQPRTRWQNQLPRS
jgi:hypothetical protein